MTAILFYEFAQKMARVIKGDITNGDFTFRLFTAVLPEKKKDLIENIPEATLRGYYNGSSDITRIAKKIYADASATSFEKFVNDQSKNARTKLSEVFSSDLTDITPDNAGKLLSKLFLEIIKDAAEDFDFREPTESNGEANSLSKEFVQNKDNRAIHAQVTQHGTNCLTITSYAPMSLTFPSGGGVQSQLKLVILYRYIFTFVSCI